MKITAALSLVLAACAGTSQAGDPDAGAVGETPPDSGFSGLPDAGPFATATHEPFPHMPAHGGSTLRNLQLVTVTFQGYPYRTFVESFGGFVPRSQWLATATQDFGPVTATHLGGYVLDAPPDGANSDFASVLQSSLVAGKLPFPQDSTGLLFLVYAPVPCGSNGGYHSFFNYSASRVAYAVSLNCQDGLGAEAVAEAASDPFFDGYAFDDGQLPWVGEVGDICNFSPWSIEGGFRFLGIWSNSAAASGGSACVPYSVGPYFNVSPLPAGPQTVDAGSSVTFTLTGWSTVQVPAWTVRASVDNYAGQDFDPQPVFSKNTVNNGEKVTLTLRVPGGTPSGAQATVRVASELKAAVDGVTGFSNDWSLQVRVR